MLLKFEWDRRKAATNLAKHRVSFDEALTVFADSAARIFDDDDHPAAEAREILIGHSVNQRLLLVCFTDEAEASASSVPDGQHDESEGTMKRASDAKPVRRSRTDVRTEYRLDYRRARRNRFAAAMKREAVVVLLDPDVAAIFRTSEAVNTVLRSFISALPERVREEAASYAPQPRAKRSR